MLTWRDGGEFRGLWRGRRLVWRERGRERMEVVAKGGKGREGEGGGGGRMEVMVKREGGREGEDGSNGKEGKRERGRGWK